MILRGSGVVAVEQGVVHTGDERIECAFADARLRGVDIGTITQVVLLQRLVREVVGTDAAMGRCARLLGVTSQSVNLMDAQRLWGYLMAQYLGGGKIDQPNQFVRFERYDGVS